MNWLFFFSSLLDGLLAITVEKVQTVHFTFLKIFTRQNIPKRSTTQVNTVDGIFQCRRNRQENDKNAQHNMFTDGLFDF